MPYLLLMFATAKAAMLWGTWRKLRIDASSIENVTSAMTMPLDLSVSRNTL